MAEIHIRDQDKPNHGYLLNGFTYPTLCGIYVTYDQINAYEPNQNSESIGTQIFIDPLEPTCMGCIMVKLQNAAEAQAEARQKASELWDVVQAFYPPES